MSTEKKPTVDFKDLLLLKKGEIENYQVPYEVFGYGDSSIIITIKVDPVWDYPNVNTSGRSLCGYGYGSGTPKIYLDTTIGKERFLIFLYDKDVYRDPSKLKKELERIGDPIYYEYMVPYMSKAIDDIAVKSGTIPVEWTDEYKEREKRKEEERKEIVSTKGYDIALVKWEALKIANLLKGLGKEAEKIFLEELNKNLKGDE